MNTSFLRVSRAAGLGFRVWRVGPLEIWIRVIRPSYPANASTKFQYAFLLEEVMVAVSRKTVRTALRGLYLDKVIDQEAKPA
jgi:hypothetical protein